MIYLYHQHRISANISPSYFSGNPFNVLDYNIYLFRLEGNIIPVAAFEHIPSEQNQYILATLTNGFYIWYLQVKDQLGNICQSVVLTFQYKT